MNQEQMEMIENFKREKNSSLYKLALETKELCAQKGITPGELRNHVIRQLCMTAGYYGVHGPKDFPLPLDVFIYLRGSIEDRSSQYFKQCEGLFTKYDKYNLSELITNVRSALLQWNKSTDMTDVVAMTMFAAIQAISTDISELDKDDTLLWLMPCTEIDNAGKDPEGVANCSLLWAFTAVHLNFEERLEKILCSVLADADN